MFAGLALLLFFGTDPSGIRHYVPLWTSAVIWPMSYVIYMTAFGVILALQSLLTAQYPGLRVPTSLIGCLSLIPAVYIAENVIIDYLSGGRFPADSGANFLFYFLSVQVIEAVFFKYVFPVLHSDFAKTISRVETPPEPAPTARQLIIGGERIPLDTVKMIEAQEHHVEVTTNEGQTRLRARLSDIVAQTSPSDGIQPHRSWWVARHAAKGLEQEAGRPVLRLRCDQPIPVARTRIDQVKTWVDNHL
ncbi:LytTR family DNA-binding domain-containing protein [Marivita sp. S0852]|uniref:LytTR family DNA-binding domain-containing protein n=1 Tax=Marivita sp. S0852 TaxID=3373893 RepID=UPI0039827653